LQLSGHESRRKKFVIKLGSHHQQQKSELKVKRTRKSKSSDMLKEGKSKSNVLVSER